MIAPSSYGALSATSANTIQGSAPWFTGQSGAKKLGFIVDGISYSEANDAYDAVTNPDKDKIISGVQKNFNAGLKLSDFVVTGLTANDFSLTTDYYDADGDTGYTLATDAFSMGSVTYDWYQGNTKLDKNNSTVMNQTLGCGSGLSLPLTLKVKLPSVKVKSRYGNPKESGETDLVQEYKIGSESGICFAKPNQMIVRPNNTWGGWNGSSFPWNSGSSTPTSAGGGYSPDFDPVNGFKASASTKFPTTGFPKASFTLIMTSNANDYTFSSNSLAVTVDTTGKVTLNSKPTGAVTIKAVYKNDTSQVHNYTFNPTSVWMKSKGSTKYTYANAKTACGGESRIPTRADFTNSPQISHPGGTSIPSNAYTRAVGGGVFGEWGWTDTTSYPGSQWGSSSGWYWHWTRAPWSTSGGQFQVNSNGGSVGYGYSTSYVACLE
ncbi:hypothetical protein RCS94_06920 [Orbaceae bacterium ac157xtp]